MSYDSQERSQQDGAPVELYEFAIGPLRFRYTSAEAPQVVGGFTYASWSITRSDIERTPERARNNITLTVPRTFPIAERFRVTPPTEVIAVTVRRYHRADAQVVALWMGRVLNAAFKSAQAELECEPVSTSLQRTGLRRKYSRQCPLVLYGGECKVVRAAHSTSTTVTARSGLTLSVASLGSKPWAGGFVEWTTPEGLIERRFVTAFDGTDLTLSLPFQGIPVGAAVTVSPGCDHTMATCKNTYANLANYGGYPFTPEINPLGGNTVY